MFKSGLLFIVIAAPMWALNVQAYDTESAQEFCCQKKNKEELKEEKFLRKWKNIQIDPQDLESVKNCRFITDSINRNRCVRNYTNPWEFHHFEIKIYLS